MSDCLISDSPCLEIYLYFIHKIVHYHHHHRNHHHRRRHHRYRHRHRHHHLLSLR